MFNVGSVQSLLVVSRQWRKSRLHLERAASHLKITTSSFPTFNQLVIEFDSHMTQSASTFTASSQRQISAQRSSPQCYRVSMFRYSETLPVWFWECWYCLCCCGACCCCASGCWMYPTVLCCGTLVVCKNAGVDPPCTSPWVICRHNKEYEYSTISRQNTFYQVLFIESNVRLMCSANSVHMRAVSEYQDLLCSR